MLKEMTIKITSSEVMELKMIRDDLVKRRPVGVAVQKTGAATIRGTDETRDFDHKIEIINAILKRAATA